jgi:hypothetical protein
MASSSRREEDNIPIAVAVVEGVRYPEILAVARVAIPDDGPSEDNAEF